MIVIGAMMRDSSSYIDAYFDQVAHLEKLLADRGEQVRFVFAENDSTDDTYDRLVEFGRDHDVTVINRSEGGPYYPSVDKPDRWKHIAYVCNGILEQIEPEDDALLYVECDLLWQPRDMLLLLDHLADYPAVSGLCMQLSGRYYDVWGSRKDGQRFKWTAPYHPALVGADGPIEMDSVASVLACSGDVARATRFTEKDAFVGWCEDIRSQGWKVWLDPSVSVIHP